MILSWSTHMWSLSRKALKFCQEPSPFERLETLSRDPWLFFGGNLKFEYGSPVILCGYNIRVEGANCIQSLTFCKSSDIIFSVRPT